MQILVARKKEISDGYMAYLLTQETSAIEQNSSSRDGKKRRQERSRDWGFDEVMFANWFLFARTLFSGLYRWRTSIKTIFFNINAGAIEWSTHKISTCYSADSVSRPHHISFQRVIFVFLIFGWVLTLCSIIFWHWRIHK